MAMLKVKDVAQELGVTEEMVYREIQKGSIKACRIGSRTIRIFPEAVEDYKKQQTIEVKRMEVL